MPGLSWGRWVIAAAVVGVLFCTPAKGADVAKKPKPMEVLQALTKGNQRFMSGQSIHPRMDAARLAQAGRESQADHAKATIISCSDSRVPVELVFDQGVMDLFVIRVAGNVCNTDEIGSIEYGMAHVRTPLLVVLGHTRCGAVTAVTQEVLGHGHALERNIPPLVAPIIPAVKKAMADHPEVKGEAIVPLATVQNVWQGVEDLFMASPAVREMVKSGKAMVVGGIYDVATGQVTWLDAAKPAAILAKVEANPARAKAAMAPAH